MKSGGTPSDPLSTIIQRLQQLLERQDITPYERDRYEADLRRLTRRLSVTIVEELSHVVVLERTERLWRG